MRLGETTIREMLRKVLANIDYWGNKTGHIVLIFHNTQANEDLWCKTITFKDPLTPGSPVQSR